MPQGTLEYVYHLAERACWTRQAGAQAYVPDAYDDEGFIHLSYAHQLNATASRYYAGRTDLLVLKITRTRVAEHLRDENLTGGSERFPHLYAPLPIAAVAATATLVWADDGEALLEWI